MINHNTAVIVLSWNGADDSLACIELLKKQSAINTIIAVDNGSTDGFVAQCREKHPDVVLLENSKNLGFAGGVNTGIRYALENSFAYIALINNDARPNIDWLEKLKVSSESSSNIGIVTGSLLKMDGTIDSIGEQYSIWGLAFPDSRDTEPKKDTVGSAIFGATGGASLYKAELFQEIGLFDEDFFAYYEDVDLSFRAQLAGWKVLYEPRAIAYHKIGATSGKIPGFTTYQTFKNLPWLLWKNVPMKLIPKVLPRFFIAHLAIFISSVFSGKALPALKGFIVSVALFPKKLWERRYIQKNRKVTTEYIYSIMYHDLPPNAARLRKLRGFFIPSKK